MLFDTLDIFLCGLCTLHLREFYFLFCARNLIPAILTEQGYRVLVVEQTETPEQLELRRKEKGSKDKVRESYPILFHLSHYCLFHPLTFIAALLSGVSTFISTEILFQ